MNLRKTILAQEAKDADFEWRITGTPTAMKLQSDIAQAMVAYYDFLLEHGVAEGDEALIAHIPFYAEGCDITLKGGALDKANAGRKDDGSLDS
jgi:hypothetical protein